MMRYAATPLPAAECLTDRDYQRLATFIRSRSGIHLPPSKKAMLEGRLRRRLHQLSIGSFTDYCRFLFEGSRAGDEESAIIDLVTTHKTYFFREPHHFDFLSLVALPALLASGAGTRRPLRVWSAGCSNGAESYSIAMVCRSFASEAHSYRFQMLATDICRDMLREAVRAVYPHDMVEMVPIELRKRYLLRTRPGDKDEVRVVVGLRRMIRFDYLNLVDVPYSVGSPIDVIFCRNVLIYFDKETQFRVLSHLCRRLGKHGYLFLGHSESINGLPVPLRAVAPTVFVPELSP